MRISNFKSTRERIFWPRFGRSWRRSLRWTVEKGSGWRENKYRQVIDDLSSRGIGRNEWRRGISFTISKTVILKGHLWTMASETNPQNEEIIVEETAPRVSSGSISSLLNRRYWRRTDTLVRSRSARRTAWKIYTVHNSRSFYLGNSRPIYCMH